MMNIETVIHTRDTNGAKQFIEQYGDWKFLNLIYANRAHIQVGVVDWVKSFVDVAEILLHGDVWGALWADCRGRGARVHAVGCPGQRQCVLQASAAMMDIEDFF
jgi:hypothetical protein